jgi:hypothetical protein
MWTEDFEPASAMAASFTSGSAGTSRRRCRAGLSLSTSAALVTYLTFSDYAKPAIRLSR